MRIPTAWASFGILPEAVRWFRLAADQGHSAAQYNLGVAYAGGAGVPLDAAEAVQWFRLAADLGHAGARYNLGIAYANGLGPQEVTAAVQWFRLAANQGHAGAQGNLGIAYSNGLGVSRDATEAARWYRLAVDRGNASAGDYLTELEATMSREEIAEAERLAREWTPTDH